MPKDKFYLFLSIILPYLTLGFLFWQMAYPHWFGKQIALKTELYDPRDLSRGYYLELKYEFTFYDLSQKKSSLKRKQYFPQNELYLVLEKGSGNFYEASLLQDEEPRNGLYLKVMPRYGFEVPENLEKMPISIELVAGIENYFLPEKEAKEFIANQSFTAIVAVAPNGTARLLRLEKPFSN